MHSARWRAKDKSSEVLGVEAREEATRAGEGSEHSKGRSLKGWGGTEGGGVRSCGAVVKINKINGGEVGESVGAAEVEVETVRTDMEEIEGETAAGFVRGHDALTVEICGDFAI